MSDETEKKKRTWAEIMRSLANQEKMQRILSNMEDGDKAFQELIDSLERGGEKLQQLLDSSDDENLTLDTD